MQLFPKKIPAAFSNVLNGGGRVGGDLLRVFRRYFIALYLIGRWRLSAALEIEEILAGADGVSAGSGSLRRVFDDLGRAAIILSETLTLDSPHTTLKLYRWSPNGEKLYQALFGKRPYENEWSRLIRLREGAQFPDHTMAVIAFAMHARKRGYAAQVLPEADNLKTLPHIWVAREDEKFYVEVEQEGGQERASRWHSIAALNGGRLALCAATQKSRARLACDCKLEKLPGLAADLESLVGIKFKEISQKTPLWLESW
ncbi:MAG: hypothetical protein HYR93_07085 [Chloroflexi bacterium]|nr:hypothetical protein [Chloroflexota bacterium]